MLIIKRVLTFFIVFSLLLCSVPQARAEDFPDISAECAVVMHGSRLLYGKEPDKIAPMASTTKLMTAIIALEGLDITEHYEIKAEWCGIEGSSMYLAAGERYSAEELITGLLLASGNDAAEALAGIYGREAFIDAMNEKARELGMENTVFKNPSGLPEDGHFSTARDMALLMLYCMDNNDFRKISAMKSAVIQNKYFTNHNKLLTIYNGCIAGKTGYTVAAGRCLVSCCERDGLRLACVTLSAPDDWNDHCALYDCAYSKYSLVTAADTLRAIPVIAGVTRQVLVCAETEPDILVESGDELEYNYLMPHFVFAPVRALDRAGRLIIKKNGELLAESELLFCESVSKRN